MSARLATLLAIGLVLGLQLLTLHNPGLVDPDHEELFNATHGRELILGHADALFRMQYRDFCGGCTLNAGLAAMFFSLFPPSFLVWKLVPLSFTALLVGLGFHRLWHHAGRNTAWAFAALLALPPFPWMVLSLVGWGNHLESGILAACGLLLLGTGARAWVAGLTLGAAMWVGFSGAYALPVALIWRRRDRRALRGLLIGAAIGLSPWLLQMGLAGAHPFVVPYQDEDTILRLTRMPHKLATLLAPRQLVALFGLDLWPGGWAAGWASALSAGGAVAWTLRRGTGWTRLLLAGLGAWLSIYLVVRFQVADPPDPQIAGPGSVRYALPLFPLLFLLLAAVAGRLIDQRRWGWVAALLGPALLSGLIARAQIFAGAGPTARISLHKGTDHTYFRRQGSYIFSEDEHRACTSTDPDAQAFHAYSLGRIALLGGSALPPRPSTAWLEGLGEALADQLDGTGQGELGVLVEAQARLVEYGLDPGDAAEALRAVAWRHHASPAPWHHALHHGEQHGLLALPPDLRDPVFWTLGRAWAHSVAASHARSDIDLPHIPSSSAFHEGLGEGLGEEWGPGLPVLPIPPEHTAAFARGHARGVSRRWL